ncbi:MAG: hypothetical protein QM784_30220 [Polyangiaceae bacterium]
MSGKQAARANLQIVKRPESEVVRKVKAGEMTLDEYIEHRIEEASSHLRGKVPSETLENLKFVMREKIRTDPLLVEAVHRATGITPRPLSPLGKK